MPSFLRIPKFQLTLALLLIYTTVILRYPQSNTFYHLYICVGFCVAFDLILTYIRKRVLFIPYAAVVTGLIMALIIHPSATFLYIATTAFLAIGIKNFLRISSRHIFNPVSSGIFISSLIFKELPSWWGVSFQNINTNPVFFLILLSPILISGFRFKKYFCLLTYLLINTLLTQIFLPSPSLQSAISLLLNPSLVFFVLVMLPEPMTSPIDNKKQIIYGVLVATIPFILSAAKITQLLANYNLAFDPLLFSLLVGNLIFFKNR